MTWPQCTRVGCPCVAFNGLLGFHCCKTCQMGQACSGRWHKEPPQPPPASPPPSPTEDVVVTFLGPLAAAESTTQLGPVACATGPDQCLEPSDEYDAVLELACETCESGGDDGVMDGGA